MKFAQLKWLVRADFGATPRYDQYIKRNTAAPGRPTMIKLHGYDEHGAHSFADAMNGCGEPTPGQLAQAAFEASIAGDPDAADFAANAADAYADMKFDAMLDGLAA